MKNATLLQRFEYQNPSLPPLRKGRTNDKITVLVKREDRNPTGSHKDRGIWPLIEYYTRNHKNTKSQKHFVISSSGNAAVSAAYYCKKNNLMLDIFVGEKIPKSKWMKVRRCESEQVKIHKKAFPRRDAFRFVKETGARLISTSTDDHCLDGYAKIVKELPKDVDAIFVPASSGALVVGLYQGYESKVRTSIKSKVSGKVPSYKFQVPSFFICQTPRVHPFIDVVSANGSSIADAISDVIGERKSQIHSIIQTTKGAGVIVEDRYIKQAMKIMKKELKIVKPSPNGSLAFAGLLKLSEDSGTLKGKKIVCLYTGM